MGRSLSARDIIREAVGTVRSNTHITDGTDVPTLQTAAGLSSANYRCLWGLGQSPWLCGDLSPGSCEAERPASLQGEAQPHGGGAICLAEESRGLQRHGVFQVPDPSHLCSSPLVREGVSCVVCVSVS